MEVILLWLPSALLPVSKPMKAFCDSKSDSRYDQFPWLIKYICLSRTKWQQNSAEFLLEEHTVISANFWRHPFSLGIDPLWIRKTPFTPRPVYGSENQIRRWIGDKILHNMIHWNHLDQWIIFPQFLNL